MLFFHTKGDNADMGEIADMILEGILCEGCGSYIDDQHADFPRKCDDCAPAITSMRKRKKKAKTEYCEDCEEN